MGFEISRRCRGGERGVCYRRGSRPVVVPAGQNLHFANARGYRDHHDVLPRGRNRLIGLVLQQFAERKLNRIRRIRRPEKALETFEAGRRKNVIAIRSYNFGDGPCRNAKSQSERKDAADGGAGD